MIAWLRRVLGICSPSRRLLGTCSCRTCVADRAPLVRFWKAAACKHLDARDARAAKDRAKRKRAGALVNQYKRELAGARAKIEILDKRAQEERAENARMRKHIELTRPSRQGRY